MAVTRLYLSLHLVLCGGGVRREGLVGRGRPLPCRLQQQRRHSANTPLMNEYTMCIQKYEKNLLKFDIWEIIIISKRHKIIKIVTPFKTITVL